MQVLVPLNATLNDFKALTKRSNQFCLGSVWIYPIYPPNYKSGRLYCQITTYKLAFAVTTLLWITLGFIFACGIWCRVLDSKENTTPTDNLQGQNPLYGGTVEAPAPSAGDV